MKKYSVRLLSLVLMLSLILSVAPAAFAAGGDQVVVITPSQDELDMVNIANEDCFDIGENGTLSARKNIVWPEILIIPDFVRGITVEAVDYCGFMYRKNIEQVYIPDSVEQLYGKAFAQCEDLEIAYIPASVTEIEDNSFSMCPSLEYIYYGGSRELWDSFGVFLPKDCQVICDVIFRAEDSKASASSKGWTVPNISADEDWFEIGEDGTLSARLNIIWPDKLVIPSSVRGITVEVIEYSGFSSRQNIEELYIPDTVEEIRGKAFAGCKDLEEVYIPASVTSIEYSSFDSCYELEHIYYGGSARDWSAFSITLPHGCIVHCYGD